MTSDVTFPLTGYTFTLEMWQENDQRGHLVPMTVNGQSMIRLHALFEVGKLEMKAMIAGAGATVFQGTTATELTIGTGEKTFTTQGGKAFGPGAPIQVVDASDPSRFVRGTSTASNATTGVTTIAVVSADDTGGTGSITAANVSLAGTPGPTNTDAVAKSGDTMTGPLALHSGSYFYNEGADNEEGGQFSLEKPDVSDLAGNLIVDINGNSLRIFEGGGAFRMFAVNIVTGEIQLNGYPTARKAALFGTDHGISDPDDGLLGFSSGDADLGTGPGTAGWQWITSKNTRSGGYGVQLAISDTYDAFMVRRLDAGTWQSWAHVLTSNAGTRFLEGNAGTVTTAHHIYTRYRDFLTYTLGANVTFTAEAVSGEGYGKSLLFIQDGVGGRVPTFTGMVWTTSQPPWASMTAGQKAEISLIVRPDGRKKLSWIPEGS